MFTYFQRPVRRLTEQNLFGLKTIIGGPHVICDPERSLLDSGADYAAIGEGERTLNQIASGIDPSMVEGLVYWENALQKISP